MGKMQDLFLWPQVPLKKLLFSLLFSPPSFFPSLSLSVPTCFRVPGWVSFSLPSLLFSPSPIPFWRGVLARLGKRQRGGACQHANSLKEGHGKLSVLARKRLFRQFAFMTRVPSRGPGTQNCTLRLRCLKNPLAILLKCRL